MKKYLILLFKITAIGYLVLCVALFFFQERIIFHPEQLDKNFKFQFAQPFEEQTITTADGLALNGLLFKADSSKGLIFYLHGNGGSLRTWGDVAATYTQQHYDVFLLDYRGYGKSEGSPRNETQLFEDVHRAYAALVKKYGEEKIIVLGYSLGTGLATELAATHHPRLLILQAPYYSLTDMMRQSYSFIPTFILSYPFETNVYLKQCQMPVIIFHGDQDSQIPYACSVRLKTDFKPGDTLITLHGQEHNGITRNAEYQEALRGILK